MKKKSNKTTEELRSLIRKMVMKWDADRGKFFKKYVHTVADEKEVIKALWIEINYYFSHF